MISHPIPTTSTWPLTRFRYQDISIHTRHTHHNIIQSQSTAFNNIKVSSESRYNLYTPRFLYCTPSPSPFLATSALADLSIIPNIPQIVHLSVACSAEKGSLLFQHRCNITYRPTFRPDTIPKAETSRPGSSPMPENPGCRRSNRRERHHIVEPDTRLCSVVFQNLSKYITFLLESVSLAQTFRNHHLDEDGNEVTQ